MKKINYNDFDEMVKAAKKRGYSVWTGKGEYFDYTGQLGIETKTSQVYWFKILDGGRLMFENVYNCNNGKTTRGFKQGFNFRWKMYLRDITEREFELNRAEKINQLNS